jgi:hypothetical protein
VTLLDGHALSVRDMAEALMVAFGAERSVEITAVAWRRPTLTAIVTAVMAASGRTGAWSFAELSAPLAVFEPRKPQVLHDGWLPVSAQTWTVPPELPGLGEWGTPATVTPPSIENPDEVTQDSVIEPVTTSSELGWLSFDADASSPERADDDALVHLDLLPPMVEGDPIVTLDEALESFASNSLSTPKPSVADADDEYVPASLLEEVAADTFEPDVSTQVASSNDDDPFKFEDIGPEWSSEAATEVIAWTPVPEVPLDEVAPAAVFITELPADLIPPHPADPVPQQLLQLTVGALSVGSLNVAEMHVGESDRRPGRRAAERPLVAPKSSREDSRAAIPADPLAEASYAFLALQQPVMVANLHSRPTFTSAAPAGLGAGASPMDIMRELASLDTP